MPSPTLLNLVNARRPSVKALLGLLPGLLVAILAAAPSHAMTVDLSKLVPLTAIVVGTSVDVSAAVPGQPAPQIQSHILIRDIRTDPPGLPPGGSFDQTLPGLLGTDPFRISLTLDGSTSQFSFSVEQGANTAMTSGSFADLGLTPGLPLALLLGTSGDVDISGSATSDVPGLGYEINGNPADASLIPLFLVGEDPFTFTGEIRINSLEIDPDHPLEIPGLIGAGISIVVVPEPGTATLILLGLGGLAAAGARRG